MNGEPNYADHPLCPFPAIRFKETTPEIQKLLDKAQGPWQKLTIEEKKILYRHSYCSTMSEITTPEPGWWSNVWAKALVFLGITIAFSFGPKHVFLYGGY